MKIVFDNIYFWCTLQLQTRKDIQMQAFPNPHLTDQTGMTLRDYFAAKAMPAVYQWFEKNQLADREPSLDLDVDEVDGTPSSDAMLVAKWSYGLADAMLKARDGD
jgi:hypothetical protein